MAKYDNKKSENVNKDFYNPYSFVPLPSKVCYLPDDYMEALETAHDVPFADARSGKITVTYEALTPFCVREGGENSSSVNVDGKYFVPATSLKGMIRSVLEVVSLSDPRNGIDNNRYSIRDLRSDYYELKAGGQKSGFLVQINGAFYIRQCQSEQYAYADIEDYEETKGFKDCKTIEEKYRKVQSMVMECDDDSYAMWFFSGHMNNKEHEYLFYIPESFNNLIPILDEEYDDFIFIHEKENENKNWAFWKKRLKNYSSVEEISRDAYEGVVPCFFRTKKAADGSVAVKDLGFSYLYRQPYKKTIHDYIPLEEVKGRLDLSQAIFGYVNGSEALKGRVHFSHSFIDDAKVCGERAFILGSPKPTYYPFYLEQKTVGKLNTYFSNNTRISGTKRYLQHSQAVSTGEPTKNVNMSTRFVPLQVGTTFAADIIFHNLKELELGALIAAITFCRQDDCCHSLGYAKPFGYGRMKVKGLAVEVDGKPIAEEAVDKAYKSFVEFVTDRVGLTEHQWKYSLDALFTIARGNYRDNKVIRYPSLQRKEFTTIKKNKESLSDFSPIK